MTAPDMTPEDVQEVAFLSLEIHNGTDGELTLPKAVRVARWLLASDWMAEHDAGIKAEALRERWRS